MQYLHVNLHTDFDLNEGCTEALENPDRGSRRMLREKGALPKAWNDWLGKLEEVFVGSAGEEGFADDSIC